MGRQAADSTAPFSPCKGKGLPRHPPYGGAPRSHKRKRGRFILVVSVALSLQPVFEIRLRPPLAAFLPDLARTFLTAQPKPGSAIMRKLDDYIII